MPLLMYESETVVWMKKEKSRAVQIDNLRGLLGIRKLDRMPEAYASELQGIKKGMYERIKKSFIRKSSSRTTAKEVDLLNE